MAAKKASKAKAPAKPTMAQAFKSASKTVAKSSKSTSKPAKGKRTSNNDDDVYSDGPISETTKTEREYPTAQQLADIRTTNARFKPIKGENPITNYDRYPAWKPNQVQRTLKIPLGPDVRHDTGGRGPFAIKYTGAGSEENKGSTGRKNPVPSSPGGKREAKKAPKGKVGPYSIPKDKEPIPADRKTNSSKRKK